MNNLTHSIFVSARYWLEAYERYNNENDFPMTLYCKGRFHGLINTALDFDAITYNTWRILYNMMEG